MGKATTKLNSFKKEVEKICNLKVIVSPSIVLFGRIYDFDAIILYDKIPVALVEIAPSADQSDIARRKAGELLRICKYPIAIVIEGEDYYARHHTEPRFTKRDIPALLDLLKVQVDKLGDKPSIDDCRKKLLEIFDSSDDFAHKNSLRPLFQSACDRLNIEGGQISFSEKEEDLVMRTILGDTSKIKKVCRYTSLGSLFTSIDGQSQAMCCMRSMNDAQEGYYADSFIKPKTRFIPRNEEAIYSDNNCFLLSCSPQNKADNLTMWRLYGDDTKGVSITYNVDNDKIDDSRFIFAPVSYGKDEATHSELDFLSKLINTPVKDSWYFTLHRWYIWRYFFKSHSYKEESEIRLVYIPDEEDKEKLQFRWYHDRNNGIFNRMVLFPLKGQDLIFPLVWDTIVLGPHSPEHHVNIEQIRYMIEDKEISTSATFDVKPSSLKNHRL